MHQTLSVKSVSVIGCGWLGYPLSLNLMKKGFEVSVSIRNPNESERLSAEGLHVFFLRLEKDNDSIPAQSSDFWKSDIFVLTLPPSDPDYYTAGIKKLLEILEKQGRKIWIIYTSSTGVYGKNSGTVDENTDPNPDRAGAAAVFQTEQLLLEKNNNFDVCILRLAGLAGPGRAAGRFFAGKKNLGSGNTPINMVHLDDCIGVINCVIEKNIRSGIFNICADKHPLHRQFYPAQALKSGLEAPEYTDESSDADKKIIDNSRFKTLSGYTYIFPDPMDFTY